MLYHSAIFLPRKIRGLLPQGRKRITYSLHAERARRDKYGLIPKWESCDFSLGEVVEVEYYERSKHIAKVVMRWKHDERLDVVFALSPTGNPDHWFCRTVWFNERSDNHGTLDPTPYVKKP